MGCMNEDSQFQNTIAAFYFPIEEINGEYNEARDESGIPIFINYHAVFQKDEHCIWYGPDGFWRLGYCDNLGGNNAIDILDESESFCPTGYNWGFEGAETVIKVSFGTENKQLSGSGEVGYLKKNGKYKTTCTWKFNPTTKKFRCFRIPSKKNTDN